MKKKVQLGCLSYKKYKKAPSWTFVILLSYIAIVICFLSKRICC